MMRARTEVEKQAHDANIRRRDRSGAPRRLRLAAENNTVRATRWRPQPLRRRRRFRRARTVKTGQGGGAAGLGEKLGPHDDF